jgi:hypothetical protein
LNLLEVRVRILYATLANVGAKGWMRHRCGAGDDQQRQAEVAGSCQEAVQGGLVGDGAAEQGGAVGLTGPFDIPLL